MIGHDPDAGTEPRLLVGGDFDDSVVLAELDDAFPRMIQETPLTARVCSPIASEYFAAGIQDDSARASADDAPVGSQRDVLAGAPIQFPLLRIDEDVHAGTGLGDYPRSHRPDRWSRPPPR